jgi:3-(3-hydroxy-phenyl)propionate hydroxylase
MRNNWDADVVVIGGGPVGATALALLGRLGLTAIGLERDEEVWPMARAVHFDGETFRTLQALGVAKKFSDATLPMASMHIENEAGEVLVSVPTGRFGSQAWHNDINFHQPEIERLLREVIAQQDGIELRCGVAASRVANVEGGAEVTAVTVDGVETVVRARWVIAADGARSETRHALGIESQKFGEDAQWLVVDGHLEGSRGLEDDMIFLGHHSRPALWVRLPGTRVRMEFMVLPGDDLEEIVTPAAVERLSRGVLNTREFTADRSAIYTFRGRIADRWRDGAIFLAGDAAHQAPPLFGQGLCAGIRDVANLAWKLDFVKRGLAGDDLLDTYETERKPHAQFWVEQAANAAGFVQTTVAEVAAQRDAFIRANPQAVNPVSPNLGPGLHSGDSDERAGQLSIQPLLADGVRLDDVVGIRFLLATTREIWAELDADLRARLDDEVVVLLDPDKVGELLAATGAQAVVVRPDRYIFAAADSATELAAAVGRIPGIAQPTTAGV